MEFFDEDVRPKFLFQARKISPSSLDHDNNSPKANRFILFASIPISIFLLSLSIFYIPYEPFQSIIIWLALSLLIGPFAPSSVTGGHIRVGHGPIIEQVPLDDQSSESEQDSKKKHGHKRSKPQRQDYPLENPALIAQNENGVSMKEDKREVKRSSDNGSLPDVEEKEWSGEDLEILKKQLMKNPTGMPGRWEAIAEAFNGRHKVDSVIKRVKNLGEKKSDDSNSYEQFLKNRKPLDTRIHEGENEGGMIDNSENQKEDEGGGIVGSGWSSQEDIALLNALKVFPKDAPMRWEKIAVALPGRSKASCMKRVAVLKKGFRESKSTES